MTINIWPFVTEIRWSKIKRETGKLRVKTGKQGGRKQKCNGKKAGMQKEVNRGNENKEIMTRK